jgi:hypothetical protein
MSSPSISRKQSLWGASLSAEEVAIAHLHQGDICNIGSLTLMKPKPFVPSLTASIEPVVDISYGNDGQLVYHPVLCLLTFLSQGLSLNEVAA